MLLGLGWPQWLTIAALVAAVWLTFKVMARASVAYERKRLERETAARGGTENEEGNRS